MGSSTALTDLGTPRTVRTVLGVPGSTFVLRRTTHSGGYVPFCVVRCTAASWRATKAASRRSRRSRDFLTDVFR
jgi:hypothetical protein